jgi:hypothetical protein
MSSHCIPCSSVGIIKDLLSMHSEIARVSSTGGCRGTPSQAILEFFFSFQRYN